MQSALSLLLPPQCVSCGEGVATDFGLCGPCWRQTPFITGLVCDLCGVPLPGEADPDGRAELCDECLAEGRDWAHGRAALVYRDTARRMVLGLKHSDRTQLVRPAARWMAAAAAPILRPDMVLVPVPLHPLRLLMRRYNQSALLAAELGRITGLAAVPDLLVRTRRTPSQEGRNREARHANVAGAIAVRPARAPRIAGRPVLLVDDVMTSGATLSEAARACRAAGAGEVSVLVLARVAKDA